MYLLKKTAYKWTHTVLDAEKEVAREWESPKSTVLWNPYKLMYLTSRERTLPPPNPGSQSEDPEEILSWL